MALGRWQRVGIGVVVLGVAVADVAVLPHLTHERAVKTAAHRRAAYLAQVRPALVPVYAALKPLADATKAQAEDAASGIDYAARDVLAHTTATAALTAAATAFDKIAAPKDMRTKAAAVSKALHGVATDVGSFGAGASLDGEDLANDFVSGTFAKLPDDLIALNDATSAAFSPEHQTAPALPDSVPPSHDSWLLGVDEACLTGEVQLATRVDSDSETLDQTESDLGISVAAGTATNAAVRKVAVPTGDAKAAAIVARLTVLDKAVAAQSAILAALKAHDAGALDSALAQNQLLLPDLAAVGTSFQAEGASACANFYSVSGSKDSGGGGSSGGSGGKAA